MSLTADVVRLRTLHEKRKQNQLDLDERATYDSLRDAFAAAYVRANHVSVRPGETCRQAVRAECAIQVELAVEGRAHKTITLDLSSHGFAALIGAPVAVDTPCTFSLRIRPELLRGAGRITACGRYGSGNRSFRVLVAFDPMRASDYERVELAVLDAAFTSLRE